MNEAKRRYAAFTICSYNYLAYARTLADSFRQSNPEASFFIFIADRLRPSLEIPDASIKVIDEEIVANIERMSASYSILEFNTSVKPHCFDYLFDKMGFEVACYLDPDILVVSPLTEIFDILNASFDSVLTPHITQPYGDNLLPGELEIARAGIFNLGFAAFRNSPEARAFISWWRGWLETDCLVDLQRGIFVDQSFCDFAPVFIERLKILRDPGYNVAYWNLSHRPIECRNGVLYVGDCIVRFIHFSGVDKNNPDEFSKYQNRFNRSTIGELRPVFDSYIALLQQNDLYGDVRFSDLEYGFSRLNNGMSITHAMRLCFRRYYDQIPSGVSPFDVEESFFTAESDRFVEGGAAINRILAEIYYSDLAVQKSFDISHALGRNNLKSWARGALPRDYGLPEAWAQSVESEAPVKPLPSPSPGIRLPGFEDLNRIARIFGFYFKNSLISFLNSKKDYNELAWNLAYSYEFIPESTRRKLTKFLELDSDAERLRLFEHWLRERGIFEDNPLQESVDESLDKISDSRTVSSAEGLAIYGFLHAETGLGQAGRGLARAFETTGQPLSCHTLSMSGAKEDVEFPVSSSLKNHMRTALLSVNADNVIHLQNYMDPRFLSENRKIGLFFWELPVFPGIWAKACDPLDEVWVPTRFVSDSLINTTSKKIRVLPLPVPVNRLSSLDARRLLGLPADKLLYLVTFDFNSFPERKNPMGAVRAFCDAFPTKGASSPLLIVKCHGTQNRGLYERDLKIFIENNPNIKLIDRVMTSQEILNLQAAIDVYISLHRAEGFGLNLAECMAAGKSVIGTNFSGNVDFMNPQNSILIDYKMQAVREGEYVAWQGQWWADPNHDAAVSAMHLLESSTLRAKLGEEARKCVQHDLSFEAIGKKMAFLLDGWHFS